MSIIDKSTETGSRLTGGCLGLGSLGEGCNGQGYTWGFSGDDENVLMDLLSVNVLKATKFYTLNG